MITSLTSPAEAAAARVPAVSSARWAVAGLSLSMLLSSLGTSVAQVGLPALAHAFGATFQAVQWVVLAYLLAVTSLIVSVGRLGDIVGRRRVLAAGLLLFTMASLLCGLAPSLGLLVAARALQGIGAAAMMALALAFVGEIVPPGQTGRIMGLLGTMSAVGTALGPSLGGVLIAAAGWRAIFLLNVPLGIAAWFLVRKFFPVDRRFRPAGRPGFDGPGTFLLVLALGGYALSMTSRRGAVDPGLLAFAGGAATLFLIAEARAAAPLIRLSLLRDRALRSGLISSGLVATVIMTTLVVGPFYLSLALGLSAAAVGAVLSVGPLVAALTGVPAGRLVDRLGTHRVTVIGLIIIAGGATLLAVLPVALGVAGYLAPIALLTAGYALFQTANNSAVMRTRPADQRGVVSGLLNLSRNLGLVSGSSVMGMVFAFASGTTDITTASPAAVATGMQVAFAVAAAPVAVALAFVLAGTAEPNGIRNQSATAAR
jgi:EmrB/QacA subfamily drug resistance transporter